MSGKKSVKKFVPLYSNEGQEKLVVKLPGSHKCDCQAAKHKLVNNCLTCGRIVCEQEGSGPCFYCGSLVCTEQEEETLNKGGRKADELRKKLYFGRENSLVSPGENFAAPETSDVSLSAIGKDLKRALAEKERLLEYQQNSALRTKVYDDETDYYNAENSQWLSKDQREKLRQKNFELEELKKRNASRLNQKYSIDLLKRKVQADSEPVDDVGFITADNFIGAASQYEGDSEETERRRCMTRPLYLNSSVENTAELGNQESTSVIDIPSRIQDLGYKELQDSGCCLSMHQPYASLLIRGIKKFEGRSWYISHRGILWIASTARAATISDIEEVETFYNRLYDGQLPAPFPDTYPSGCLLGCVRIDDCLSQEQYRLLYPFGESSSPYVAICSDPRELHFKFPVSGKHKIYKLDPKIHLAAKRGIEGVQS